MTSKIGKFIETDKLEVMRYGGREEWEVIA